MSNYNENYESPKKEDIIQPKFDIYREPVRKEDMLTQFSYEEEQPARKRR